MTLNTFWKQRSAVRNAAKQHQLELENEKLRLEHEKILAVYRALGEPKHHTGTVTFTVVSTHVGVSSGHRQPTVNYFHNRPNKRPRNADPLFVKSTTHKHLAKALGHTAPRKDRKKGR